MAKAAIKAKTKAAPVVIAPEPPGLAIEWWPVDRPQPYPGNARKMSDRAADVVAASIKEFGWRQPIVVDRSDVIVVGHTRHMAAHKLGEKRVPVHVATNLTPAQVKAYRLADNRTGEETTWDADALALEMAELQRLEISLDLTGFDAAQIEEMLKPPPATEEDSVPDLPETPTSVLGDLWLLGKHRVLCGDSTDADAVARLMAGKKADMVFTDPPYNVDYDPEARELYFSAARKAKPLGKIKNDTKSPADFRAFLDAAYTRIDEALKPGHAIYVCHADTEGHHFRNAFIAQPWRLQSCVIWRKTVIVFGRADYQWIHEPVLYGWKEGAAHVWCGDRTQTSVWDISTDHYDKPNCDTEGYAHPTQKPVALVAKALFNSSEAGAAVLNLFGGSGSTLIACEKNTRHARLMELDPRYVDVIVERWQRYTNRAATLEGDGRTFAKVKEQRARDRDARTNDTLHVTSEPIAAAHGTA